MVFGNKFIAAAVDAAQIDAYVCITELQNLFIQERFY